MTPEEVTLALKEATDAFPPLGARRPTDDDLVSIRESLSPILMTIPYDAIDNLHNLWGVIAPTAAYTTLYATAFPIPRKLPFYDDAIASSANVADIRKQESKHKERRNDRALYEAANRGACKLIYHAVDETWYQDLKSAMTFYTQVTAKQLLDHLEANCTGLHTIDAVELPSQMKGFYADAEGIPQYIIAMEEAQKKAQRAQLPISDAVLLAIANRAMIASNDFPDETREWEGRSAAQKTWADWKSAYKTAYEREQRRMRLREEVGQPFGGTVSGNSDGALTTTSPPGGLTTQQMSNSLEGFLDNIAAAATNDSSTLEQLVKSMAQLTCTNAMQQQTIADLRKELAALRVGTTHDGGPKGLAKDGYCWKHGYKVGVGHTSRTCRDNIPEDKRDATRANTKGGSTANKGWDA